jgi:hypothetical protein
VRWKSSQNIKTWSRMIFIIVKRATSYSLKNIYSNVDIVVRMDASIVRMDLIKPKEE